MQEQLERDLANHKKAEGFISWKERRENLQKLSRTIDNTRAALESRQDQSNSTSFIQDEGEGVNSIRDSAIRRIQAELGMI